ncbi:MAG: hypothetical protein ACOY2B_14770 [Pseudomonadota bacterium]
MLYTILNFLIECWRNWLMLFYPLPYGDPYLAVGALGVLYFPIRRFIKSIF